MQVHLAMALQRRASELEQSAPQLQRPRVVTALRAPLIRGVPTAAGWLCLAGLYRKDGNPSEALWAARMVRTSHSPLMFGYVVIARWLRNLTQHGGIHMYTYSVLADRRIHLVRSHGNMLCTVCCAGPEVH